MKLILNEVYFWCIWISYEIVSVFLLVVGGGDGVMCQHEHLFVASEIKLSLHKKNKQLWHSHWAKTNLVEILAHLDLVFSLELSPQLLMFWRPQHEVTEMSASHPTPLTRLPSSGKSKPPIVLISMGWRTSDV